ncbi:hypothetical protein L1080_004530 [Rhodococcus sp. MSC1_016]|uniref:hypothetical protein n=1 Tax=Rhodococcus sp. MSC1_016 TaxID=2909266 RepID=UPI00202E89CB|nr:hypothetical protein [Rhodococcus sp. MSC1_016]
MRETDREFTEASRDALLLAVREPSTIHYIRDDELLSVALEGEPTPIYALTLAGFERACDDALALFDAPAAADDGYAQFGGGNDPVRVPWWKAMGFVCWFWSGTAALILTGTGWAYVAGAA